MLLINCMTADRMFCIGLPAYALIKRGMSAKNRVDMPQPTYRLHHNSALLLLSCTR